MRGRRRTKKERRRCNCLGGGAEEKTAEGNEPKYALRDEEARKATEWEQAQTDKAREALCAVLTLP